MYDPNVCTPTMFEDELRALATMRDFVDPQLDARIQATHDLQSAIKAVREIPGWTGSSAVSAEDLLGRMQSNASKIEGALEQLRKDMRHATDDAAEAAASALRELPSASAEGLAADLGRGLAGLTNGMGALDTGEAVAREEERLKAERETAAMNALGVIRRTLTEDAARTFSDAGDIDRAARPGLVLPSIDVDAIDASIPPIGSNAPGGSSPYSQSGAGDETWGVVSPPGFTPSPGLVPAPGAVAGLTPPSPGGDYSGGSRVDSPAVGTLPGGTNAGTGGWPSGGSGAGVPGGSGSGLLPGGGGHGGGASGLFGGAGAGAVGAAALLGARSAASSVGTGGSSVFRPHIGGGAAAGAGRGLLGAQPVSGSTAGSGGAGATGASSAASSSAAGAGGRSMAPGMMGGGAGGDGDKRRGRSTLGGPIAPEFLADDEPRPLPRSARAGSRDDLR